MHLEYTNIINQSRSLVAFVLVSWIYFCILSILEKVYEIKKTYANNIDRNNYHFIVRTKKHL